LVVKLVTISIPFIRSTLPLKTSSGQHPINPTREQVDAGIWDYRSNVDAIELAAVQIVAIGVQKAAQILRSRPGIAITIAGLLA
jgi:hypothetical protein